ncbi:hypothetical protein HK104_008256 [Borealophlyctis nickersoniae]|nr:hypothetical protein HK104_008256 [Borealophlyctis nickersoniae]
MLNRDVISKDFKEERPVWRLSCYAPGKDSQNLIAGTDMSPEEVRWEMLQEMKQTGGTAQTTQKMQQLEQHILQELQRVLNDPKAAYEQVLAQQQQQQQQQQQPSSSVFGASSTATPSAFGGLGTTTTTIASQQQQPPPAFGASSGLPFGQSGFGAQATTSGPGALVPFGTPPQQTQQQGVFATPPSQTAPAFGASASALPFGQSTTTPPSSALPFGHATTSAPAAAPGGAFGSNASTFGQPSTAPPAASGGLFGGALTQQQAPSVVAGGAPQGGGQVDDEAMKAFMAPKFEFGKIPEVEPPIQVR